MELRYCKTHDTMHSENDVEIQCALTERTDWVITDPQSRQRAEEALMEGFSLGDHGPACHCDDCGYLARCMVDTVIEAWRGR